LKGGKVTGNPLEPPWVSEGSGAFAQDAGKVLYATGESPRDYNLFTTLTRAADNARGCLAQTVDQKLVPVLEDFVRRHKDWFYDQAAWEKFVSVAANKASQAVFKRCEPKDRWTNSADGRHFVLVSITVEDAVAAARSAVRKVAAEKQIFRKEKAEQALAELDAAVQSAIVEAAKQ